MCIRDRIEDRKAVLGLKEEKVDSPVKGMGNEKKIKEGIESREEAWSDIFGEVDKDEKKE